MTLKFMGKKRGMTRIFDDQGNVVVCTVISAEPNVVSQIKRTDNDGHNAIQLAAEKVKPPKIRNVSKPLMGHFKKAGIEPRRYVAQSRIENIDAYQVGQEIDLGVFAVTEAGFMATRCLSSWSHRS